MPQDNDPARDEYGRTAGDLWPYAPRSRKEREQIDVTSFDQAPGSETIEGALICHDGDRCHPLCEERDSFCYRDALAAEEREEALEVGPPDPFAAFRGYFTDLKAQTDAFMADLPPEQRQALEDAAQKTTDLLLYGNAYEDADGRRIDPTSIRISRDEIARAYSVPPHVMAVSPLRRSAPLAPLPGLPKRTAAVLSAVIAAFTLRRMIRRGR